MGDKPSVPVRARIFLTITSEPHSGAAPPRAPGAERRPRHQIWQSRFMQYEQLAGGHRAWSCPSPVRSTQPSWGWNQLRGGAAAPTTTITRSDLVFFGQRLDRSRRRSHPCRSRRRAKRPSHPGESPAPHLARHVVPDPPRRLAPAVRTRGGYVLRPPHAGAHMLQRPDRPRRQGAPVFSRLVANAGAPRMGPKAIPKLILRRPNR